MKPHRLKLTHHLVLTYGLYRKLEVYVRGPGRPPTGLQRTRSVSRGQPVPCSLFARAQRPHHASQEEMTEFHADDYVDYLRRITPDNTQEYVNLMQRCAS